MPNSEEFNRNETEAVCQKLLAAGWITEFCFHERKMKYGIKWAPKGLEQAERLNTIGKELLLNPQEFYELLRIVIYTIR